MYEHLSINILPTRIIVSIPKYKYSYNYSDHKISMNVYHNITTHIIVCVTNDIRIRILI